MDSRARSVTGAFGFSAPCSRLPRISLENFGGRDEALNRAILREMLSTVGFDVAEADSSEQALSLINDGFGVVISDIRMPGHDGHTFCRKLRSTPETKGLIIIASSASVFSDDQRQALAAGFNDFLPKPIIEEELFEILGRHLDLKWIYAQPL